MVLSRLWIIRKIIFVAFVFVSDIVFDCGITSSGGFQLPGKGNSSSETGDVQHTFLKDYFHSALSKTRTLEETIYADLVNNLRNLIKVERSQIADSSVEAKKKPADKTRNPVDSHKSGVFSSGGKEELKNGGGVGQVLTNVTVEEPEYFLGYSGDLFGSRRPVSGLVELPENDSAGRGVSDPRRKRSVLHLYNMVLCTTGCNPFAYKGYGCYCGFLGSGFVVDGIDSCCKMHDWCYNSAGCPMFLEYFIPYLWKCYHRQPLCAIDHGHFGGPGSCAQRLCECDKQLALCLRRYPCPSTKALCTSSPWRLLQNVLTL